MKTDHSRSVSMQCTTCGGAEFEFESGSSPVRCTGCNRIYMREELIRENGARIESELKNVKADIAADIRKDFSKMFKKFK